MNSIYGMFMEAWVLWISCKIYFTLQETRSIHVSMIPYEHTKIEFITYIYIYIISQVSIFNFT